MPIFSNRCAQSTGFLDAKLMQAGQFVQHTQNKFLLQIDSLVHRAGSIPKSEWGPLHHSKRACKMMEINVVVACPCFLSGVIN